MKRWKHTLSHYKLATGNMGELLPLACIPVLPGDTFQMHTNALVRVSPLVAPVMHPTAVRIHHWFVPNRILDDNWEDFITGGSDGANNYSLPTIDPGATKKTVPAYLGAHNFAGNNVLAYPTWGFNRVFNEFYRDQDLVGERLDDDTTIPRVAWEKDYYSTARPWTQKGPDVIVPVGESAPVITSTVDNSPSTDPMRFFDNSGNVPSQNVGLMATTTGALGGNDTPGIPFGNSLQPANLIADLASVSGVSVNDFRASFAIQRYQEARARYGSRFTEYLRYLGVTPADSRLQRPEFLGGGVARLQFSEVLQTAPTSGRTPGGVGDPLGVGDMYGHGIAGARSNRFRKFFQEHGFIITTLSVRPKALYVNNTQRELHKRTKEEFFQKELSNLGQQEVYQNELYGDVNNSAVFGYQDRYQEYRYHPSQVCGDFKDTLNGYHMGRDLAPGPILNGDFVTCQPSDRIFQVLEEAADTLWIMANHHVVARRIVPKRANPRIL